MARRPACISRTLRAIDNRIGRIDRAAAGANATQLRHALDNQFQHGQLPIFHAWAAASGLPAHPKLLDADQLFDALYCIAWHRAYLRPASEYVAMQGHNAEQFQFLAA